MGTYLPTYLGKVYTMINQPRNIPRHLKVAALPDDDDADRYHTSLRTLRVVRSFLLSTCSH